MAAAIRNVLNARQELRKNAFFRQGTDDDVMNLCNHVQNLVVEEGARVPEPDNTATALEKAVFALDTIMPTFLMCHDAYATHILAYASAREVLNQLRVGNDPALEQYRVAHGARLQQRLNAGQPFFSALALEVGRDSVASRRLLLLRALPAGVAGAGAPAPQAPQAPQFGEWQRAGGDGYEQLLDVANAQKMRIAQLEREAAELQKRVIGAAAQTSGAAQTLEETVRAQVVRTLADIFGDKRQAPAGGRTVIGGNTSAIAGEAPARSAGADAAGEAESEAPFAWADVRGEAGGDVERLHAQFLGGDGGDAPLRDKHLDMIYRMLRAK